MTETPSHKEIYRRQRPMALVTAMAAILFALGFLGLLVHNGYQHYVLGVQRENQLADYKQQLQQEPDNSDLITEIRELDLAVREHKLTQLAFARRAGLMMLLAALIAFCALKWSRDTLGVLPQLASNGKDPIAMQQRGMSRFIIGLVALLLVGGIWAYRRQLPTTEKEAVAEPNLAANWHRFRGLAGAGVTPLTDIPKAWNGASGQNILWKSPIPLPGHNSPIVWEDKVFLSGATEEQRAVYCFSVANGQLLWTGEVPTKEGQEELEVMEDTGLAANTMATDGTRVYAIFATGDIAAFDFSGKRLWHRNLGTPDSAYGYATSLDVWQNNVIVQYDQAYAEDGKSAMLSLVGTTGKTAWSTPRPVANSWTSPIITPVNGSPQLIAVGAPWVIAYHPGNGKEIWRAECVDGDVAPSPIMAGDLMIAVEPYAQSVAVRVTGQGNVTDSHIVWRNEDCGPDIASPVCDSERVYMMDTMGMIYAINTETGELVWEHDYEEEVQASPSLVNGQLYVLAKNGVMFIGTPGADGYIEDTKNELGEDCFASPAFMPGRIFIRGEENLFCIGLME